MASHPTGTKRAAEMLQTPSSSTPTRSATSTPAFLTPSRPTAPLAGAASPPPVKRGKLAGAAASPPPMARGKEAPAKAPTASAPAPTSPPLLRGLSSEQPALWARVFFTPEGAGRRDTAGEARVLAHITDNFDIPDYLPVPLSGLTGEERLRVAYYQGHLTPKKGLPPPSALRCSACGGEGHAPDRCAA